MTRLLLVGFAVFMMFGFAQASATDPIKVPAEFGTLYVPHGFDSNDQVQFVGEGVFSNTCFRSAGTHVRVNRETRKIYIEPEAYEYDGFCLMVIVPFDRVVDVGLLQEGTYEIVQTSDWTSLGSVEVRAATTASPDDYLYAPISQAFFRQVGGKSEIHLTGDFPNSCMKMDEVRIDVQPKVIVVQPIARMEERADCVDGKFPFAKTVPVVDVKKGRYLLHVRSMNAKAVNNLVDVQ